MLNCSNQLVKRFFTKRTKYPKDLEKLLFFYKTDNLQNVLMNQRFYLKNAFTDKLF